MKRIIIFCITACVQATTISSSCEHALQGDHRYLAAQADYAATTKQEAVSRDALKPQLHSHLIVAREHFRAEQANNDSLSDTYLTKKAELLLEQPLIDFSAYRQLTQASIQSKKAAIELEQAKQTVWLTVADHYLEVLKQEALYRAAASERQTLVKQEQTDKKRLESGVLTKADWLATDAQLAAAEAHEIAMHGAVLNAVARYKTLTDIQHPHFMAPAADYHPPKPTPLQISDDTALAGNLTIQSQLLAAMIAQKNIDIAQAQHYPTVHAYGAYTNQHHPNGVLSTYSPINDTETSSVGINIQIPVYQGGQVMDQVEQAQYYYESAAQHLAQSRNDTAVALTINHHDLITDFQKMRALQHGVAAAKSALASQQAGYDAGTKTNVALLHAITQLQESESEYALALYGYLHNRLYRQYLAGDLQLRDIRTLDRHLQRVITIPALAA